MKMAVLMMMITFLGLTCTTSGQLKNTGTMKIKRFLIPSLFNQVGEEICIGGDLLNGLLGVKPGVKPRPMCGPPPSVCGANVTVGATSTVAYYQCQEPIPGDSPRSVTSRCDPTTGEWSPVELQCYKTVLVETPSNQANAKTDCEKRGMTLLNLRNIEYTLRFSRSASSYPFAAWTGLEYNSTARVFVWPDGRKFSQETDWDIGDPNNEDSDRCVVLLKVNFRVDNRSCDDRYPYVCSC